MTLQVQSLPDLTEIKKKKFIYNNNNNKRRRHNITGTRCRHKACFF